MPLRIYFCHLLKWVFVFSELPCLLMKTALQKYLSHLPQTSLSSPVTLSLRHPSSSPPSLPPPLPLFSPPSFSPSPPPSVSLFSFSPLLPSQFPFWTCDFFCTALQWVLCKETWLFLLSPSTSATMSYPWRGLSLVLMWRAVEYAPIL